mgnify:FL=1
MNCMNCGAFLTAADMEYCPHCGSNVLIQRKVDYLSKYYYNQGLEKASIRDLSGAIGCLKQSLTYNKANIQARNLLGLVYFETGEVVAALSEWVISKNLMPNRNLASEYIEKLQANPNKLEAINETIKKYNHALIMCRQGHEDMAAIQLKKLLSQNSKLIKGYHLLALIQMKNGEWNRARRTLKKAARIDKTNTTTLRFLREVDEQTGVTTSLEKKNRRFFRGAQGEQEDENPVGEMRVTATAYREHSKIPLFLTLLLGIAAGAAALWLLAVPAIRQSIYREANNQIIRYSESLASQGAELTKAQGAVQQSDAMAETQAQQLEDEQKKTASYEALMEAYAFLQQGEYDSAALSVQNVHADVLPDSMKGIYDTVCSETGVTGIEGQSVEGENDASTEAPDTEAGGTGEAGYEENGGTDDGSYDDGSGYTDDGSYDDGSGYTDDGSYDDGSGGTDDGYYE